MIDQKNIQGDIWPRLPKKFEKFIFFRITNVAEFKKALPVMADYITTAETTLKNRENIKRKKADGSKELIKMVSMNIAFSASGLSKLSAEKFNDDIFNGGQFKDMTYPEAGEKAEDHQGLDDQHDWVPELKPSSGFIDGCLTVTGDSEDGIEKLTRKTFDWVFNIGNDKQSIEKVYSKDGKVYPDHREHFGWVDGISQPLVKGLDDVSAHDGKGMKPVDPGVFLIGHEGDKSETPKWAKDGSFMVFRIYEQLVPEFFNWCSENCPVAKDQTRKARAEGNPVHWDDEAMDQMGLFSSRAVGRWPNGAVMEHHPLTDPNWKVNKRKYSEDELKALNNTDAFNYNPIDQTKCPYASHMRKTGPRDDYAEYAKHVMLRRGIPYGPWCDDDERGLGVTKDERGLLFVSYQSSIENGFVTQQKRWANAPNTPSDMAKHGGGVSQGIDVLIGQVEPHRNGKSNGVGINAIYEDAPNIPFPSSDLAKPASQPFDSTIDLHRLCVPHGGEYFFAPSISALKDYLPNA
ncbi:hypothetical protein N7507_001508 [Penicillium longicatenatum]|nr:hypothetical protein N7507_001508 [Penicillium longicatenatum]